MINSHDNKVWSDHTANGPDDHPLKWICRNAVLGLGLLLAVGCSSGGSPHQWSSGTEVQYVSTMQASVATEEQGIVMATQTM